MLFQIDAYVKWPDEGAVEGPTGWGSNRMRAQQDEGSALLFAMVQMMPVVYLWPNLELNDWNEPVVFWSLVWKVRQDLVMMDSIQAQFNSTMSPARHSCTIHFTAAILKRLQSNSMMWNTMEFLVKENWGRLFPIRLIVSFWSTAALIWMAWCSHANSERIDEEAWPTAMILLLWRTLKLFVCTIFITCSVVTSCKVWWRLFSLLSAIASHRMSRLLVKFSRNAAPKGFQRRISHLRLLFMKFTVLYSSLQVLTKQTFYDIRFLIIVKIFVLFLSINSLPITIKNC